MLVYSRESCRMRARSQEGSRSRFDVIQEIIVDFEQVLQKCYTFLFPSPKSLYIGCQLVQNGTCRSCKG